MFKSLHQITCNQVTNDQFKRYHRSRIKYNARSQLPDETARQYHPYTGRISSRNFRPLVFQMNSFLQEFRATSKFVSLMILCETFVLLRFISALYVAIRTKNSPKWPEMGLIWELTLPAVESVYTIIHFVFQKSEF